MHKIFKPFFTTKEKGTGLGLAVTKRLIGEIDGSITVGNLVPTGCVFEVIVPDMSGRKGLEN